MMHETRSGRIRFSRAIRRTRRRVAARIRFLEFEGTEIAPRIPLSAMVQLYTSLRYLPQWVRRDNPPFSWVAWGRSFRPHFGGTSPILPRAGALASGGRRKHPRRTPLDRRFAPREPQPRRFAASSRRDAGTGSAIRAENGRSREPVEGAEDGNLRAATCGKAGSGAFSPVPDAPREKNLLSLALTSSGGHRAAPSTCEFPFRSRTPRGRNISDPQAHRAGGRG